MTTATVPATAPCACEAVYMVVLVDYLRRLRRYPARYTGLVHHRCGRGLQPAPSLTDWVGRP